MNDRDREEEGYDNPRDFLAGAGFAFLGLAARVLALLITFFVFSVLAGVASVLLHMAH